MTDPKHIESKLNGDEKETLEIEDIKMFFLLQILKPNKPFSFFRPFYS
jgi:hypothetical protein